MKMRWDRGKAAQVVESGDLDPLAPGDPVPTLWHYPYGLEQAFNHCNLCLSLGGYHPLLWNFLFSAPRAATATYLLMTLKYPSVPEPCLHPAAHSTPHSFLDLKVDKLNYSASNLQHNPIWTGITHTSAVSASRNQGPQDEWGPSLPNTFQARLSQPLPWWP